MTLNSEMKFRSLFSLYVPPLCLKSHKNTIFFPVGLYLQMLTTISVCNNFTCLQFLVPIRRAMEQKLLKYVPCSTRNRDSSAPLHGTTQQAGWSAASSPGRCLVGVWLREFPSVSHRHRLTEQTTFFRVNTLLKFNSFCTQL